MRHFSFIVTVVSGLSLVACGASGEEDSADVDSGIQPQAGEWTIMTTGWTNDDCNSSENLTVPTSITFADVDSTSFRTTFFENGVQVGSNSICSHDGDDVYSCEDFTNGFSYTDVDATISMVGVGSITLTSETEASGGADFVMECEGEDCNVIASYTNSGIFPCDTTLNWTAEAN